MNLFLPLALCLRAFVALCVVRVAVAQLSQDYILQRVSNGQGGTTEEWFYQPTPNNVPIQVIDLSPQVVQLRYNCYYLKNICRNMAQFVLGPRGNVLHPDSGLPTYQFGYDFNTPKNGRSDKRRKQSCPTSTWKNRHPCPEVDQRQIWRRDGLWPTTDLEPGTQINEIKGKYNSAGVKTEDSKMRYTCDEFPAATWIEGGNGAAMDSPSNTFCAPLSCGEGGKTEQNWQGLSHGNLRTVLINAIRARQTQNGDFPFYSQGQSVAFFQFAPGIPLANGIAAEVWLYSDIATNTGAVAAHQTVAKRDGSGYRNMTGPEILAALTDEQRQDLDDRGLITKWQIPADNSSMLLPDELSMDFDFDWENGDEDHYELEDMKHERDVADPIVAPLLRRATAGDLERARAIVADAIAESSKLNAARLKNPLRNHYGLRPGTVIGTTTTAERRRSVRTRQSNSTSLDVTPLLQITDEIAAAAALVAEADATARGGNVTKRAVASSGTFWMDGLSRKGAVPWGDDPDYVVFRNVLDYGAVGDGVTDDTEAISKAMTDGKRCGKDCNGSTTKNAIVYFPPGTYLISSSIAMPFGTQVIGDANNRPVLKAAASFVGLGVLSTDEYTGGGTGPDGQAQEYYVNTANFYRQLRNLIFDITLTDDGQKVCAVHYQVAQATSTQNLEIRMASGSAQQGIFAENGSGGQISDVVFIGGAVGLYGGTQQFTAQRLSFSGCTTGVQLIWDWGWTWKSITMENVGTGFALTADSGGSGTDGSAIIMDSSFTNVGVVVQMGDVTSSTGTGSTGLVLDNVILSGVATAIASSNGVASLDGSATNPTVDQYVIGPTYDGTSRDWSSGSKFGNFRRTQSLLDSDGAYFERAKPQYEDQAVGNFVHVKDFGAAGDGTTDDTAAFQAALWGSSGKILFVDAGSYLLTSTVTVPLGTKIVGETWSQLVAYGSYFSDANNPQVMLKVGNAGDVGNIEMQDLFFTTRGPTAGAILVEWNVEAETPGSAGLWDCHARVGGATGTELTPAECPASTSGVDANCNAASLMMHLTSSASGYFENMWLWGADHMIDDPDLDSANNSMVMNSVYVARGFLIESVKPTWLYGVASEHSVYYQFNFHKAANIFAGLLQTESPYYQPTPQPPAPFTAQVGVFAGDPSYDCAAGDDFSGCDESWSIIMTGSENVLIASACSYSWFSTYSEDCIDGQTCQKALVRLEDNYAGVRILNFITIGAEYMAVMDGEAISAVENMNANAHPFWSQVTVVDVSSNGTVLTPVQWVDAAIWDMDQPQITCSPPCNLKIPPWTKATSVVNYPVITVSQDTWTSRITKPPFTISEWVFDTVSVDAAGRLDSAVIQKRAGATSVEFMPVPASTPYWPSVVYSGPDGIETTVAPDVAFPTPPPSIGPNATPPQTGSWPKREIQLTWGSPEGPLVPQCSYFDFGCQDGQWLLDDPYGTGSITGDDGDSNQDAGPYDEDWEENLTMCPVSSSTSTTTTKTTSTTTTTASTPTTSPKEEGNPLNNEADCYNSGQKTEHVRLDNTIEDFCNSLGQAGDVLTGPLYRSYDYVLPNSGGGTGVDIVTSLTINADCQWTWDMDTCKRYMEVPVDSCNCDGVNGKQGGIVKNECYAWRVDPNTDWN